MRLEQRAPQRLELAEVVLAVAAGGPARLRVPEAALPASQRVGAYAEELGRCVGSDSAHSGLPSTPLRTVGTVYTGLDCESAGTASLHRFSAEPAHLLRGL